MAACRPRLKATAVLAAALLWVTSQCDGSDILGSSWCDTGKLHLDRDLPVSGVRCNQTGSAGREFAQTLHAVDKVHDPEPAAEICMDRTISYNQSIPHSGAYRPVSAESGEYRYCPPQRWLNNLHGGASVLLYHPCTAARERQLLSTLARSCLPHYILSPHPQLSTPVALVSWGRTLELPTAASAEVCHWLEATALAVGEKPRGDGRKYNLLLTRSAEQQQQQQRGSSERSTGKTKESVWHCCERILSSQWVKVQPRQRASRGAGSRKPRASARGEKTENTTTTSSSRNPQSSQTSSGARRSSSQAPGSWTQASLRVQTLPRCPQQSVAQTVDQTPPPSSDVSGTAPPGPHVLVGNRSDDSSRTDSSAKESGTVEVRQRELESRSRAPQTVATQPAGREAAVPGGAEEVREASTNRLTPPRTPRTDEAVWAAAALGFLLILLALSVLHTRLYRHWRRGPSLYWQHPVDHYDSVAEVIRRRLQQAKRRRRRSRRQEVVLLPSSSSSDELP